VKGKASDRGHVKAMTQLPLLHLPAELPARYQYVLDHSVWDHTVQHFTMADCTPTLVKNSVKKKHNK
jgi:hypothetical protein